jgi:hypothetical protein
LLRADALEQFSSSIYIRGKQNLCVEPIRKLHFSIYTLAKPFYYPYLVYILQTNMNTVYYFVYLK